MDNAVKIKVKIVVISLAFIILTKNAISLIISNLIINFPKSSVMTSQLVFTLMLGMAFIGSLLFGLLSSKVRKKSLSILFLILILIGAAVAMFYGVKSINIMLLASTIIGIGLGGLSPLIAAVISDYFQGPERATVVGMQTMSVTIGGIIYPIVGGYLTAIHWTYDYLVFSIGIPILLIVLFLMPKGQVEPGIMTSTGEKVKVWTSAVKCWVLEMFIAGICWVTITSNITSLIRSFGFADFVKRSTFVVLAYALMSLVLGVLLRKICAKFGKSSMTYGLAMLSIGLLIIYLCNNASLYWLTFVGAAFIGLGFGIFMAAGLVFIPQSIDRRAISKALAYFLAASVLGSFINPYVITVTAALINNAVTTRFLVAGCLSLLITIFAFATQKIKNAAAAPEIPAPKNN